MKSVEILEQDPRGIFDVYEMADFFGVKRPTIVKWRLKDPDFPKGWKIGSKYFWEKQEVLDYLKRTQGKL